MTHSITINVFRSDVGYEARGTLEVGGRIVSVRGAGATHADAMRDALDYALHLASKETE